MAQVGEQLSPLQGHMMIKKRYHQPINDLCLLIFSGVHLFKELVYDLFSFSFTQNGEL